MPKLLKKNPSELNCGESLVYAALTGFTVAGAYALGCGAVMVCEWAHDKVKTIIRKKKEEAKKEREELNPCCVEEEFEEFLAAHDR